MNFIDEDIKLAFNVLVMEFKEIKKFIHEQFIQIKELYQKMRESMQTQLRQLKTCQQTILAELQTERITWMNLRTKYKPATTKKSTKK